MIFEIIFFEFFFEKIYYPNARNNITKFKFKNYSIL